MRSFRIAEALVCVVAVALIGVWLVAARLSQKPSCPPPANHPEWSVARRWNEALLGAIRRDLPNPPVHARNLFHNSVAMWDAWAAYDPMAQGYLATEKQAVGYVAAARDEAISYAAYRVLASRFAKATGADQSLSEFDAVMDALCYPVNNTTTDGTSPAAVGNRIAASVLAYAKTDGSNEGNGYKTPDYKAVNQPLVVNKSGTTMIDPNHWQPLQIEHMISQNGIPVTNGVQQAIGPHWGHVKGFALPAVMGTGSPVDPGPPPELGDPVTDQAFKDQAVEVVHLSSQLDPADGVTIDISPGAQGANTLGTNDGQGHAVNTATGQPYPSNVVLRGNFGRAIAEFWADGPESETPPGHWNVLANQVSDELDPDLRVGGIGDRVDRLQWDVKMYLALNGAAHDAAIAAWGLKGRYDGARPISMIRYLGELGQSSDPTGPSYNREGLPLVPGLIEVITKKSSAPGQRHSTLAAHLGEIAVRALVGIPADSKSEVTGVEWILAVDWIPYQLPTFVTPAFQGYISGHSTFSRAAAEVLTGLTGSEYFPGGVFGYTINQGSLKIEKAPTAVIRLEWATYYDAADQAGRSRLWGGIHVASDDLTGRDVGSQCGQAAWAKAQQYYAGQVPQASG